jgi:hypothetical protein
MKENKKEKEEEKKTRKEKKKHFASAQSSKWRAFAIHLP